MSVYNIPSPSLSSKISISSKITIKSNFLPKAFVLKRSLNAFTISPLVHPRLGTSRPSLLHNSAMTWYSVVKSVHLICSTLINAFSLLAASISCSRANFDAAVFPVPVFPYRVMLEGVTPSNASTQFFAISLICSSLCTNLSGKNL